MVKNRSRFFLIFFWITLSTILIRFFYWQVIRGDQLHTLAQRQRFQLVEITPPRGQVYASDNYPLVLNRPVFLFYAYLPNMEKPAQEVAQQISSLLVEKLDDQESSPSAMKEWEEKIQQKKEKLTNTLSSQKKWVVLERMVREEAKENIEALTIEGLGFQQESARDYPEASMAAHLLGFVGLDENSKPKGYFGLEGKYDQQLSGASGFLMEERDILGQPIFSDKRVKEAVQPGLNLSLYLERPAQFILEEELEKGIEKYGAKSGWGIIIDPSNGGVLAMASFPNYDPGEYTLLDKSLFSNPIVSEGFEPGSIFKPFIMAAALEEGVVKPETECSRCNGPKKIGDHQIKTWNDQYHPQSTMTEVIQNSDNVGMVFVSEELGKKKILASIKKFGFGQETGIDLQGEAKLPLREEKKWYPIDLAAVAFGQGILTTPIQITRAFASLANQGKLVEPKIVQKVWSSDKKIEISPKTKEKSILSLKTTEQIKEMLVNAVENGDARWTKLERLIVAGKTGTAQIPVSGHYDEEKTIASFVGFAPADSPKFVMLISLREPSTSPWGSETAAPIWFSIANKLAYLWNLL